jgi:RNA polymerase sigma-70 factor (ECF subfamily)
MDVQKVWEDYGSQLKNFLVSRVSTPEDADDLLQEILIKTHNNLSSIKEPEKFKSWLYQIARNTIIDHYRKKRPNLSVQDIQELKTPLEETLDPANPVFTDIGKCIKPFLAQLPEMYREAIEAIDLKGTSQKDFAEESGLGYSTVKSRVQRGRVMLGDLFHDCCTYQLDARGEIIGYTDGEDCC